MPWSTTRVRRESNDRDIPEIEELNEGRLACRPPPVVSNCQNLAYTRGGNARNLRPFAASVNPLTFEQDFDFVTKIRPSRVCPGFVRGLSDFRPRRIFSAAAASIRIPLTENGALAAEGPYGQ